MEREGCSESMLNYSATATQVVTCARCFLQRFNPGPRDSIWAFYSLLGAVAMGLCMSSRARCAVHGKQFVCAEFGIRAESVRSGAKSPLRERNMTKRGLILMSLSLLSLLFTLLMDIVLHFNQNNIFSLNYMCVGDGDLVELVPPIIIHFYKDMFIVCILLS